MMFRIDTNGKYFYIKDGDTIWNPGWQPTKTELDSYECRHGIGYSRFAGSKNGIQANILSFVPMNDNCEISQLKINEHLCPGEENLRILLCRVVSVERR